MYRFSDVVYDADSSTATIGTGLVWDDVYSSLAPFSVNVVGGRVTGVGVAGFTLGGGTRCSQCYSMRKHSRFFKVTLGNPINMD